MLPRFVQPLLFPAAAVNNELRFRTPLRPVEGLFRLDAPWPVALARLRAAARLGSDARDALSVLAPSSGPPPAFVPQALGALSFALKAPY